MLAKIITNRQFGNFVYEQNTEPIIDGSYVWWLVRHEMDLIVAWDYGNLLSCTVYFPTTSEDYETLIGMAKKWNNTHGWNQVEKFARFRIEQIEETKENRMALAPAI